jgi:SOS response regulatory protein OraA/RecX
MADTIKIIRLEIGRDRAKLTLSNLDTLLTISLSTVAEHRLVQGVIITESQAAILIAESELFDCDRRAARILAGRDHSVGELKVKLRQRKFSADAIDQTIKKYKQMGALDDEQYALKLAERLVAERPCGRPFLIGHLKKKYIPNHLIDKTANLVLTGLEEVALARAALDRRWYLWTDFDIETTRKKAYNYLARRGFTYPAAKAAFELMQESVDEVRED